MDQKRVIISNNRPLPDKRPETKEGRANTLSGNKKK